MNKQEAKFQTTFNHWLKVALKEKDMRGGFAFELKHTRGKAYLPFAAVEDHQLTALLAANTDSFIYKISDESRSYKPFDCFALRRCHTYIVIKYPSFFVLITTKRFIKEKERSEAKSLTEERAKKIAIITVELK